MDEIVQRDQRSNQKKKNWLQFLDLVSYLSNSYGAETNSEAEKCKSFSQW